VDFSRCFTIAAYSAFVVLRRYLGKNPGVDIATAISIILQTNSDNAALDFNGGTAIHQLLPTEIVDCNSRTTLRLIASELVKATQPWWLRLVPYGRERVRSALDQDQVQFLREAGLFDAVPDAGVAAWWDDISAAVRGTVDSERMLRAREAERLSLSLERERLKSIGVALEPKWVSLEDNTLGYDIQSYNFSGKQIVCSQNERSLSTLLQKSSPIYRSIKAQVFGKTHALLFGNDFIIITVRKYNSIKRERLK